jgi:hypothetical protein
MCKSMYEQFSTWMDWIWSSRCLALLCTSKQSNNLKWVSGGRINSSRRPKSCWLKAVEISTVRWSDAMIFQASVHLVLMAIALHCTWPLTQLLRCFLWHTAGSSGAEELLAKTLLFTSLRPPDEPLLHRQFIRCWSSSLGMSLSWFKLSIE